jgi:hypothetical protein
VDDDGCFVFPQFVQMDSSGELKVPHLSLEISKHRSF